MLLASWNVNGLRAAHGRGLCDWLDAFKPDVLLLQETKARPEDLPDELRAPNGHVLRLHPAERRGYSGVAICARREPDEWIEGLGVRRFDVEGRVLSARFGDVLVSSVYFPNSQAGGARLPYRLAFARALRRFVEQHRAAGLCVVLGGDFNVAHRPIDLARPAQNVKNPGYLPAERRWMDRFLAAGWVDAWRRLHPERAGVYSWWSFRHDARRKNIGWRLDYICVHEASFDRVLEAGILDEVEGSDHCPVTLRLAPAGRAPARRAAARRAARKA